MSDSFYVTVGAFFLCFGFVPVRNYLNDVPLRGSYHQLQNHQDMMANLVEHNPSSDWMHPLRDFSFADANLFPPPGLVETDLFGLPLHDNVTSWHSSNTDACPVIRLRGGGPSDDEDCPPPKRQRRSGRRPAPIWKGNGKAEAECYLNAIGDAVLDVVDNTAEDVADAQIE